MLTLAGERFEVRMAQEMSGLRQEMCTGLCTIRNEIAATRVELIRWSFLFWIGQVAAVAGLLAFMLRATGR